jgi:sulfur relay protein TusB/DsrH
MLHLIFQASPELAVIDRMAIGDAAVFLESGVLSILRLGCLANVLEAKRAELSFYALKEDMAIRGILVEEIAQSIVVIDYADLVQLTVEHPLIQSWT